MTSPSPFLEPLAVLLATNAAHLANLTNLLDPSNPMTARLINSFETSVGRAVDALFDAARLPLDAVSERADVLMQQAVEKAQASAAQATQPEVIHAS